MKKKYTIYYQHEVMALKVFLPLNDYTFETNQQAEVAVEFLLQKFTDKIYTILPTYTKA